MAVIPIPRKTTSGKQNRRPGRTRIIAHYTVGVVDLASHEYRCLGVQHRKSDLFSTMRLARLCELTAMKAGMPPMSLGVEVAIKHINGSIRGDVVAVEAECVKQQRRYWEWHFTVRDAQAPKEQKPIAQGILGFVADIDRKDYEKRRLAPKRAARSWWRICRLRINDALSLLLFLAPPIQAAYLWHSWVSRLATVATLTLGWFLTRIGVPKAIRDWITIRTVAIEHGDKTNDR